MNVGGKGAQAMDVSAVRESAPKQKAGRYIESKNWRLRTNMPDRFHQLQMVMAFSLAMLSTTLYFFAPAGKSEVLSGLALMSFGFVVGKATNGFQRKDSKGE